MKLVDKIQEAHSGKLSDYSTIYTPTAEVIEKIADDYAIEFGNWLNNHVINTDGRHHNLCFNSRVSQLFPIFKKEKGL